MVSIVNFDAEKYSSKTVKAGSVFAYPNPDQLKQIALLLVQKKIKAPEIAEFLLKDARKAQELMQTGHVRGKIVIRC